MARIPRRTLPGAFKAPRQTRPGTSSMSAYRPQSRTEPHGPTKPWSESNDPSPHQPQGASATLNGLGALVWSQGTGNVKARLRRRLGILDRVGDGDASRLASSTGSWTVSR